MRSEHRLLPPGAHRVLSPDDGREGPAWHDQPVPIDRNIAALLALIGNAGYPPIAEGTVEQARRGMRALFVDLRNPKTLPQVGAIENTVAADVPVRVYRPQRSGPVPTVVYLHGGGWVIGDLDTADPVCRLLCRDVEAVVVSVDYRRAPEHRFPAAVDDSWAALRWVGRHIDDFGGDATRLGVGGDSAGGNLAAVCAQLAHAANVPLAAQLLIYPAVELLGDFPSRQDPANGGLMTIADMRWAAEHYVGMSEDDPRAAEFVRDPRLSPLCAESLAGLAPAVVVTAEFDPLRDEGNAYARALEKAGVRVEHREFPSLVHGFYGLEMFSPAVVEAMNWTNLRFKELLG
jgi:acetyl esterase